MHHRVKKPPAGRWEGRGNDLLARIASRLFLTSIGGSLVSFLFAVTLAHQLGPESYGVFASVLAILAYLSLGADLGFFASGATYLVHARGGIRERSAHTVMLLVFSCCAVVMTVASFLVAATVPFDAEVRKSLLIAAPVAAGALAPYFLEQLLKGSGRVDLLADAIVVPRVGLLIILSAFLIAQPPLSVAVVAYEASFLAAIVFVACRLPLGLQAIGNVWSEIRQEHRDFGKFVFVGRVVNLLAFRLDVILLALVRPSQMVGFYILATTIFTPVVSLAQSTYQQRFRHLRGSPLGIREVHAAAIAACGAAIVCLLAGGAIVLFVLGSAYYLVLALLPLTGIASIVQGSYQPLNSWLLANGMGVELRSMLFRTAIVNAVAYVALVPTFGAIGAAVAAIVGNTGYLLLASRAYHSAVESFML